MIHTFRLRLHLLLTMVLLIPLLMLQVKAQINKNEILYFHVNNPAQAYAYAGKQHWNNREKRWDKVIVVYNKAPDPDKSHPVYQYVSQLKPPKTNEKHQYNLHYKSFYLAGNCDAQTALSSGRIWRINFDKHSIGPYASANLQEDWNCPKWTMGRNLVDVISGVEAYRGKALRLRYPQGSFGCENNKRCVNWKPTLGGRFNQITYSYKLKLGNGFEFVNGGKLPGVGGGKANTGGKKPNGSDGWSVRVMWNRQGKLVQYVYHPDQPRQFGEAFEWNMNPLERGKWHTLTTTVKINTPHKHDGQIQSWLNGKLVLDKRDIRFRDTYKLQIEKFMFASFYGGSDSSWAPKNNQVAYFDEFVIMAK